MMLRIQSNNEYCQNCQVLGPGIDGVSVISDNGRVVVTKSTISIGMVECEHPAALHSLCRSKSLRAGEYDTEVLPIAS